MADKIVIEGIAPYDGEYELDAEEQPFTHRELHTIKKVAGVRVGEITEALNAGDTDMIVALAVIALKRHGKQVVEDLLWDSEGGAISYQGEEEVEAVPPVKLQKTPSDELEKNDEQLDSTASSGNGTSISSDLPENGQSRTGQPDSASTVSDLLTSAS